MAPAPNSPSTPSDEVLGQPMFASVGGVTNLYLSSSECTPSGFGTCSTGQVWVNQLPLTAGDNGNQLAADLVSKDYLNYGPTAVSTASRYPINPPSLTAIPGDGYRMVAQTSVAEHFSVLKSSSPAGPWTLLHDYQVTNDDGSPCGSAAEPICYAIKGHGEQSGYGLLRVTYYDTAAVAVPTGFAGKLVYAPILSFGY